MKHFYELSIEKYIFFLLLFFTNEVSLAQNIIGSEHIKVSKRDGKLRMSEFVYMMPPNTSTQDSLIRPNLVRPNQTIKDVKFKAVAKDSTLISNGAPEIILFKEKL